MSSETLRQRAWQAEADLLADGRDLLERLCATRRYAYLYPHGANLALLLEAYEALDRWRDVRHDGRTTPRQDLRRFAKLLRKAVRSDALARDRRLQFGLPLSRPQTLGTSLPDLVLRALTQVDADARREVEDTLIGRSADVDPQMTVHGFSPRARVDRGLAQFRDALTNLALANPAGISGLHPQFLGFTHSPQPTKRRHPIASWLLVTLPLQFLVWVFAMCSAAYFAAYWQLNDTRLAAFLTHVISRNLDGELAFDSVHWRPRLIVDLILGTPTPVDVNGVRVYAPFKSLGLSRDAVDLAAHAERLEVGLVLHEIIPWNRLGVPGWLEIPWVLHFGTVSNEGRIWVRSADEQTARGLLNSLTDAFAEAVPAPIPSGHRGLSVRLDDAQLRGATVSLQLLESQRWATELHFDHLDGRLDFLGQHADEPEPARLPFRFRVEADGGDGTITMPDMLDGDLVARGLTLDPLENGYGGTTLGDMRLRGAADLAGSPTSYDGTLHDVFGDDTTVGFQLSTTDAGGLAQVVWAPEQDVADARPLVSAPYAAAKLSIDGPIGDPSIRAAAQGITLDPFPDPAWALDDVDVSLVLARDPVPELWHDLERATDVVDSDERWVIYIETFRGAALDGEIRLHRSGGTDHIVLPDDDVPADPLLVSMFVDLAHGDPAQLVPDSPELASSLRGSASGSVDLHRFAMHEIGDETIITESDVYLRGFAVDRDRGPDDDGFPRQLTADGTVRYSDRDGFDVRGLKIGTAGGHLLATGGLSGDGESLDSTQLSLRVDNGPEFLGAFGVDNYFDTLLAELTVRGRVGAPSSDVGQLTVTGVRGGELTLSGIRGAKLWLDKGTLFVRSPRAELLGGHGPLEVDLVLFDRGQLLDDPRLRVFLDLEDVDADDLLASGVATTNAALRLYVDDGNNAPVPLSQMAARGAAYAEQLEIAGTRFSHADASFTFRDEAVHIERLAVAYHRPLSPLHAPDVRVEVGALRAEGTIGFQDDPELDLEVRARNLPLATLTTMAGLGDDVRGYIGNGTAFSIDGTLSRPDVHGQLQLAALSIDGVPLGSGSLIVGTQRKQAEGGTAAHRLISAQGRFGARRGRTSALAWEASARIAMPDPGPRGTARPSEIEFGLLFGSLPVDHLLAHPDRASFRDDVDGELRDASLRVEYCPAGSVGVLPSCRDAADDDELSIAGRIGHLWVGADSIGKRDDPCADPTAVCSDNPVEFALRGDTVDLASPWRLRTGGPSPSMLTVDGSVDLGPPPPDELTLVCTSEATVADQLGLGHLVVRGDIDLGALAPWTADAGLASIAGKLDTDVVVDGLVATPSVSGRLAIAANAGGASLRIPSPDAHLLDTNTSPELIPIDVRSLTIDLDQSRATIRGDLELFSDQISLTDATRVVIAGPCAGQYRMAATGELDGSLPHALFPDVVSSSSGTMALDRLLLSGRFGGDPTTGAVFDEADVRLGFDRHATRVVLDDQRLDLRGGVLQTRVCTAVAPCADQPVGSVAVFLGGERGAYAGSRPRQAIDLGMGERGSASLWGTVTLPPDLDGISSANVHASLARVPYVQMDNAGRPELDALLSSDRITLEADPTGALSVRGDVLVERARWLRDAVQGVAILSFEDPVPAAPTELPALLRDLRLDIGLHTAGPFQIDNNVLVRVEGRADVRMTGTLADPELTGELTVERGVLDLAILGDEYLIDHGRVTVEREFTDSFVDVVAVGKNPVRIDNQLQYITVRLSGALDEIRWECSALGDTSGQLGTTRGCVDYLVFDAGDVNAAEYEGLRGSSSPLLYTGKPLALVSKLLELNLNPYLEDEVPRAEAYLPEMWVRAGHLGLEAELEGRPEWLEWDYGNLGFDLNYLRGYPGALLRDAYSLTGRIEILDDTAMEAKWGRRSYSQRVLVLEPPRYRSIELVRTLEIPSIR